ncbi:hypothetical protein [Streptosporangium lutulentum]|uniref:Uncharacterized protein n=1 Tax=Streptosporangium lutulentum TaxID=1461250 RepID=A0ABT9QCZ6_9ACTN|nr:hypothetical protein [Streptosporangium lutulentum]MDP9844637.1 hypothetical protein [Streptosporangium lutulentum]
MPDSGTEQKPAPTAAFGSEVSTGAAATAAAGGTGETNERPTTAGRTTTEAGARAEAGAGVTGHEPPRSDQDLDTSPLSLRFGEE